MFSAYAQRRGSCLSGKTREGISQVKDWRHVVFNWLLAKNKKPAGMDAQDYTLLMGWLDSATEAKLYTPQSSQAKILIPLSTFHSETCSFHAGSPRTNCRSETLCPLNTRSS